MFGAARRLEQQQPPPPPPRRPGACWPAAGARRQGGWQPPSSGGQRRQRQPGRRSCARRQPRQPLPTPSPGAGARGPWQPSRRAPPERGRATPAGCAALRGVVVPAPPTPSRRAAAGAAAGRPIATLMSVGHAGGNVAAACAGRAAAQAQGGRPAAYRPARVWLTAAEGTLPCVGRMRREPGYRGVSVPDACTTLRGAACRRRTSHQEHQEPVGEIPTYSCPN